MVNLNLANLDALLPYKSARFKLPYKICSNWHDSAHFLAAHYWPDGPTSYLACNLGKNEQNQLKYRNDKGGGDAKIKK